jgi:hypothetical protein
MLKNLVTMAGEMNHFLLSNLLCKKMIYCSSFTTSSLVFLVLVWQQRIVYFWLQT